MYLLQEIDIINIIIKIREKLNYTCDFIERQIEAFGDGAYCLEKNSEVDEVDYCKGYCKSIFK